jgi:hypothetical protein
MIVIKDALPYILRPLTDIVNYSLRESTSPSVWKLSEVIPLLKEGDHEIAKNNRPISLLPAASTCSLGRIYCICGTEEMLKSTPKWKQEAALHRNIEFIISVKILKSMDDKEVVAVVLLDLSKAFDSIDHALLLEKLQAWECPMTFYVGLKVT